MLSTSAALHNIIASRVNNVFPQFKDTKVTEINKVICKQEDAKTSEHHIISGKASLGVSKQLTKLTKKETITVFGTNILSQMQQLVRKVWSQKKDIYIYM